MFKHFDVYFVEIPVLEHFLYDKTYGTFSKVTDICSNAKGMS